MIRFIYRYRIIMIVVFCFIAGALVGSNINVRKMYYGYDRVAYKEACSQIKKNEKESQDIISHLNDADPLFCIEELENAKLLLMENLRLFNKIDLINNLDREHKVSSLRLKQYTQHRLHYIALTKKKIEADNSTVYDKDLEELEVKIHEILNGKSNIPSI